MDDPQQQTATCAALLRSKTKTFKTLHIADEVIWKTQQEDADTQNLNDKIMETREISENPTTKFTILEDKVYIVVQLPYKTPYQIYIPSSLRPQLLHHYHDDPLSGHLGRYKTYKRLPTLVYWLKMSLDVWEYVRCCQVCQVHKPEAQKPPGKLQQTLVHAPWEMIGVDFMGPFPQSSSGNQYHIVFVDYYTRWIEMFPLRQATAETVSQILRKEILTRWRVPTFILSDQGPQFVSAVFEETCRGWNLQQKETFPYHP